MRNSTNIILRRIVSAKIQSLKKASKFDRNKAIMIWQKQTTKNDEKKV